MIYLILHDIRSSENVGSILRTADAVGVERVYLTGYTPAPIDRFGRTNKKVIKASLGAERNVKWEKREDIFALLGELEKKEICLIALEQSPKSIDYKKVKIRKPTALILGNEVDGLPEKILSLCDMAAEIPMRGEKESLNVSVACGIALFGMFD